MLVAAITLAAADGDTSVVEAVKAPGTLALRALLQRKANVNVRKYERRGITARNRLERQIKRARTQFERELRQRRNQVTSLVK